MGGLAGYYEYSYSFWADDSIIPLYALELNIMTAKGMKTYLFDIRTSFKLRGTDGQITDLGWERFGRAVFEDDADAGYFCLEIFTKYRLKSDYGMSDDQIRSWAVAALAFAKQTDLADDSGSKRVIAVAVGLDVVTVQQEGEPINAAKERAIKTESLIPIYVWFDVPFGGGIWSNNLERGEETICCPRQYYNLLRGLPRERVEDEAATCAVCSHNSAKGTQMSPLPTCNHFVHPRCLYEWLRELNSCCPTCSAPIPTDEQIRAESTPPISSLLITD